MRRVCAAALTLVASWALVAPNTASADSTVWQKTKSPRAFQESEALLEVNHLMAPVMITDQDVSAVENRKVLEVLEAADAKNSSDPRVLMVLANALADRGSRAAREGNDEAMKRDFNLAAPLYRAIVSSSEPGALTASALSELAICAARFGDFAAEAELYDMALSLEPIGYRRARLLSNQAEAFMVHGDISRAVAGYRAAISSPPTSEMRGLATTFWGLGVALDRSGDVAGGVAAIGIGRSYDPDDKDIKGPGWFFVPSYDADWYWGLEALLRARSTAADPILQNIQYERAIEFYTAFVERAPADDHYVSVARARLVQIRSEAAEARERNRASGIDTDHSMPLPDTSGTKIDPLPMPH